MGDPLIYHWYKGALPPFGAIAINVSTCPERTVDLLTKMVISLVSIGCDLLNVGFGFI